MSGGSGFIVREDGLILSNAHVVSNNVRVHVKLTDGREMEGTVQCTDPVSDLATIKINAVRNFGEKEKPPPPAFLHCLWYYVQCFRTMLCFHFAAKSTNDTVGKV